MISKNPINIRGRLLGGAVPLLCIPIVSDTEQSLRREISAAVAMRPDMLEWRADYFKYADDSQAVRGVLEEIRPDLKDIPLLFTFRSSSEGGAADHPESVRLQTIREVLRTGRVDLVDVEAAGSREYLCAVEAAARETGVKRILSYHDLSGTVSADSVSEKLLEEQRLGADILKIAFAAGSYEAVLELMCGTYRAVHSCGVDRPVIAIASGEKGRASRIFGGAFGSCLSFVVGGAPSAAGQIGIDTMRKLWKSC